MSGCDTRRASTSRRSRSRAPARRATSRAAAAAAPSASSLTGCSWGGGGRVTAAVRDAWWYPVALPLRARGLRRPPLPDLPRAAALARSARRHRPRPRRPPPSRARSPLDARSTAALLRPARRARGDARDRRLGVHAARARRARSACPRSACASSPTPSARRSRREGPRAEGDYVLAVGTLEPRKNLPAPRRAAVERLGVELRVVGARGWGGVEVGGDGVRWLGERRRRASSRASTAARSASRTRRCTRASGSRCSRRWPAARRSSRARARRWRRSPTAPRCSSTRSTRLRSRDGHRARDRAARRARRAAAPSARARSRGSAAAEATVRVYRGGRRCLTPLVVIDADVLGREPHRRRDLRREPAARAARRTPTDLRLAAVTRRPDLVPPGVEPVELRTRARRSCAWR